MKALFVVIVFTILNLALKAEGPYRRYLLSKIYLTEKFSATQPTLSCNATSSEASIPRYQIPKGNIFCRMEDKLTKATKVWIKVGVQ
ncbi:MAG: hypothetical protein JWO06_50 [Bacteroidota bacterium]|nr:hypothetical protein [Bacteroidota bacterium]